VNEDAMDAPAARIIKSLVKRNLSAWEAVLQLQVMYFATSFSLAAG